MFSLDTTDTWAPHCAVFDCDGVLLDSETLWNDVQIELFDHYDVTVTKELETSLIGSAAEDLAKVIAHLSPQAQGKDNFYDQVLAHVKSTELEILDRGVVPIPGALDFVKKLAAYIPVAVASNSSGELLAVKMQKFGYADIVTTWVSSSDVPSPKPSPDIYLEAVRRLGFSPEQALTVEDSVTGMMAATGAGTRCLIFTPETPEQKELLTAGIGRFDSFKDAELLAQVDRWLASKA